MSEKRLKIAYLSDLDPRETWTFSGGNNRIYNALQTHVGDVHVLSRSWGLAEPLRQIIHRMPVAINLRTRWRAHLALSKLIAGGVRNELSEDKYDVLFCAFCFHSLANIKTPYPMLKVFTSDATQTLYRQSEVGQAFGSYLSVARYLDPWVTNHEKRVFQANDINLWPSDWLKDGADTLYDLKADQSVVVPWGGNIEAPAAETLTKTTIADGQVRLLLVGRDWFAKGGATTFAVLKKLLDRGVDAHLTVIGCVPPDDHTCPQMTIHPSLNKADPEELALFEDAYKSSHFLVMPSFESYGFAFCEASAYGLPSLCLRVGGVPVKDGANGFALPDGSNADDFADRISYFLERPSEYEKLRSDTRAYFDQKLNWAAWGRQVSKLINDRLG